MVTQKKSSAVNSKSLNRLGKCITKKFILEKVRRSSKQFISSARKVYHPQGSKKFTVIQESSRKITVPWVQSILVPYHGKNVVVRKITQSQSIKISCTTRKALVRKVC